MLTVTFETGPMAGQQIAIQSELVLGRQGDLVVDDQEASRRHAVVRPSGGGFEIEDLGSLNGTMVDDTWIQGPTALHDGSVIRIGQTALRVALPPAPEPVAAEQMPDQMPEQMPAPPEEKPPPQATPASEEVLVVPPPSLLRAEPEQILPLETALPATRPEIVAPEETPAPDLVGTSLGQYDLEAIIRRDELFTIFRGYQASLDRYVVLKVLTSPRDPEFVERFRLEARILARLQHPNIVPIYEQGEHQGRLYLVMQYLDSEVTLADVVGEPMEPIRALKLMAQVLSALDYAHSMHVIHRNVKPANIMLPLPTWPMLAGFDIAKLVSEGDQPGLTRHGLILGTAAYTAPEQAFGLAVDGRTDVYSAGIVLYEMLTGRVPFEADSPQHMLSKQAYEPPPPPRTVNPDLPAVLEPPLVKALEKDPSQRYQGAGAMAQALENAAAVLAQAEHSDPMSELYRQGVEAFDQGRWAVAINRLSRLAELDPGNDDVLSLLEAAQGAAGPGAGLTPQ